MMLSRTGVYAVLAAILVEGGYTDGGGPVVAADANRFADLADVTRTQLRAHGVEVEAGRFEPLPADLEGVPGKYIVAA